MEFVYIPTNTDEKVHFVECFHLLAKKDQKIMIALYNPKNEIEIEMMIDTIPLNINNLYINVDHTTLPLFCKVVDQFNILSLIDLE